MAAVGVDPDERAAVAQAAALGARLCANVDDKDAEGLAAKAAVTDFASKMAELNALIEDSDDEELPRAQSNASELQRCHMERLEQETAWQFGDVGLEMQQPFSQLLLSGAKTVETRSYCLPASLVGRPIAVLETECGAACGSALADNVAAGDQSVRLVGTVTFGSCFAYASADEWDADSTRHRVPATSAFSWTEDRMMFGWVVASATPYEYPMPTPAMRRQLRSLFQMDSE